MTKKCIFKVTVSDEIFKVTKVVGLGDETLWAVMNGRVYANKPFLYQTPDDAINRAIFLAKLELQKEDILMFEP